MSVKVYAVIFGILFLALGLLGFVPALMPDGFLLGIFQVNTVYSILQILTGLVALGVAFNAYASRMYFKFFAIIYLFISALSILLHGELLFIRLNPADEIFNLVMAAIAIYLGFGKVKNPVDTR